MLTFLCNKLGRDKIFELCQQQNIEIDAYIMNDTAYKQALAKKLQEEAEEVIASSSPDELLEELADVQEVIDALLKAHGFTSDQLRDAQLKKREKKGGFNQKIYISSFSMADDCPAKEYFSKQPHKYPLKK